MDKDLLKQRLIEYGMDLGFGLIGFTDAKPLELWDSQISGRGEDDPESIHLWDNMEHDPKRIMPTAKSVIVAAWPYTPYKANFPEGIGRFSAHYREYPKGRDVAFELGRFLKKVGYEAMVHPPLPAKELALRAGIGYFGKNSLIHTEKYGSWISLHFILTDANLSPDTGMETLTDCGDCDLCISACPNGAIKTDGRVIPSKCLRHHMLSSDFVPGDIRDKIGNKMLGCDICQMVCPFNKCGVSAASLPAYDEMTLFDIGNILNEWPAGLKKRMDRMGQLIGQNYARSQKVLSAAIIFAGNSKDRSYLPDLKRLLKHSHGPIRGHSAWAIGEIGSLGEGEYYKEILEKAIRDEKDARVIEEMSDAIDRLG
ncbi:MAG TPA: 4Fe-4S double cluster binding domain-containing protein [Clostridia bacterium]|nr:4Fe-4S double cluster binding domain-containing protein [Clostridia bacterium]